MLTFLASYVSEALAAFWRSGPVVVNEKIVSLKTNFCFRVRPTILGRQWSQVDIVVGWGQCDQMAR